MRIADIAPQLVAKAIDPKELQDIQKELQRSQEDVVAKNKQLAATYRAKGMTAAEVKKIAKDRTVDPYAAIRSLSLRAPLMDDQRFAPYIRNREAGYVTDHGESGGSVWDPGGRFVDQGSLPLDLLMEYRDAQANNRTDEWQFGDNWRSGDLTPFASKYEQITNLGGGRVNVRMQRPGMHKYDTMDVPYKFDPASGQYVMEGNPEARREQSSMQQMVHDPVDIGVKFVGTAAAMYAGAHGLNALAAGGAGGAGAGAGAAGAGTGAGASAGVTATGGINWGAAGTAAAKQAATNAIITAIQGGDISQIGKAAIVGGLSGGAGSAVSSGFGLSGAGATAVKGAVSGGIGSAAYGGDTKQIVQGMFSGAVPGALDALSNAMGVKLDPTVRSTLVTGAKSAIQGKDPKNAIVAGIVGQSLGRGNPELTRVLTALVGSRLNQRDFQKAQQQAQANRKTTQPVKRGKS